MTASDGPIGTTPADCEPALLVGAPNGAGCVATRLAIDRICPVLTSITTAVPLTAFEDSMALASACSDSYCSCVSRVNSRPVPGVVATSSVTGDCGMATPEGDSTIVSLPLMPANFLLSPYSRPPAPCPAALVNPITGEAKFPLETTRLASSMVVIPGIASASICWPVDVATCRASTT